MQNCYPAKKRVLFFFLAVMLWQLLVIGKVLYLKVFQQDELEALARSQKEGVIRVPGSRGKIFDCTLEPLAASIPFASAYVYTPEIKDKEQVARKLAKALGQDPEELLLKLTGKQKFRYIKRYLSPAETDRVHDLDLKGVGLLRENRRVYPNTRLGSNMLGAVSIRNDEEFGLEGLERYYDQTLAGQVGELVIEKDGKRNIMTTRLVRPPLAGQNLVTNISAQIQHIVESELAAGIERYGAGSGMIVVMEPGSGKVLAMASYPGFDPNSLKGTPRENLRNLTVERYFEPGSTFKIVATSAVLEENKASLDEIIYCGNGYVSLSGHIIRDHKAFQNPSLNEILANSSDVGVIKLALRLGEESFYQYISSFGFGQKTGIDLPAEEKGFVRKPSQWSKISIGSISMGQEVGVSCLQILRAMAVIANGGYLVRPYLVDRIIDENGQVVQHNEPERIRVLSSRTATQIRDALTGVVAHGTGKRAAVPGYQIAGKTGTAQIFDSKQGCYSPHDFVASFVGFFPAEKPAFAMAVIYDSPKPVYHGGEVSAPVFAEIARQILLLNHIKPSVTQPVPELVTAPRPSAPAAPAAGQAAPATVVLPEGDSLLAMEDGPRETVITLIPEDSFTMPDFSGKSLRIVMKQCAQLGLILQPSGSGIAIEQIPPPGALIKPATRCTVWFSSDVDKLSTMLLPSSAPRPGTNQVTQATRP
mgnify:CR=1 FL=1